MSGMLFSYIAGESLFNILQITSELYVVSGGIPIQQIGMFAVCFLPTSSCLVQFAADDDRFTSVSSSKLSTAEQLDFLQIKMESRSMARSNPLVTVKPFDVRNLSERARSFLRVYRSPSGSFFFNRRRSRQLRSTIFITTAVSSCGLQLNSNLFISNHAQL